MLRPENMTDFKKVIWASIWEKENVCGASVVHFTSTDELEAALACGWKLPAVAVIPIPVACNGDIYKTRQKPAEDRSTRNVVFVGRLAKVKRLDLLLDSFALVRKEVSNAVLKIVGPDQEHLRPLLETQGRALGLSSCVEFLGMKSQSQLHDVFNCADVGVLVSSRENFGMAAAEAMAHGLPVVLTKDIGIGHAAKQAKAAIVVDDKSREIADALILLLSNDSLHKEMGAAAYEFVKRNYDPLLIAKQLLEVYEWIEGRGHKPDCVRLN
jgi:glycosyltransferase involved in cell wall biosynthesis